MTFVVEQSVPVDTPGSDACLTYSNGCLIVTAGGRSVTFSLQPHQRLACVVEDTHQDSVSPAEIPDVARDHVLDIGYRIPGDTVDDGGFELLRGDNR